MSRLGELRATLARWSVLSDDRGYFVGTIEALIAALDEMHSLHLADDDDHGTDCKRDHGPMILLNPESCASCRIFVRFGYTNASVQHQGKGSGA